MVCASVLSITFFAEKNLPIIKFIQEEKANDTWRCKVSAEIGSRRSRKPYQAQQWQAGFPEGVSFQLLSLLTTFEA